MPRKKNESGAPRSKLGAEADRFYRDADDVAAGARALQRRGVPGAAKLLAQAEELRESGKALERANKILGAPAPKPAAAARKPRKPRVRAADPEPEPEGGAGGEDAPEEEASSDAAGGWGGQQAEPPKRARRAAGRPNGAAATETADAEAGQY